MMNNVNRFFPLDFTDAILIRLIAVLNSAVLHIPATLNSSNTIYIEVTVG